MNVPRQEVDVHSEPPCGSLKLPWLSMLSRGGVMEIWCENYESHSTEMLK